MNRMSAIATVITVLPERTKSVSRYLASCRLIITMMTGNTSFPEPTPPLSVVSAKLDNLAAREELARRGGKGAVAERDVALREAHIDMTMLKAYVQSAANAAPEQAEAIIHSAGMNVAKQRTWTKLPIEAKHGDAPGKIVLDAKALPKPVQYRWQMSTDQQTWTDLRETFKTKTIVEGLAPATFYSFRLQTVTNSGPSDWSPPVTIIAH
jgi:hypothetical protein